MFIPEFPAQKLPFLARVYWDLNLVSLQQNPFYV
jgi:hypothetical protein